MGEKRDATQLLNIARKRLHPSITNPNYLVLHRRAELMRAWMSQIPGKCLRVLDVGGRYQPYRPLLENRDLKYFAIDVESTPFVDVLARGEQLPFREGVFDIVIATSVFEYIAEPRIAADQIHRVLKPGGVLLMSVAAIYPRAGQEEYWRFLPAGLRSVLTPFSKVEIVPEVSSIGGFLRVTNCAFSIFAKYSPVRKVVHHTIVPALNMVGRGLERSALTENDQMTGNYSALAQK